MQNFKNVENLKFENCQDWINPIYRSTFPPFSIGGHGWKSGFMFCCEGIEFCGHSDLSKACVSLLPICSATWIKVLQIQPHRAHMIHCPRQQHLLAFLKESPPSPSHWPQATFMQACTSFIVRKSEEQI